MIVAPNGITITYDGCGAKERNTVSNPITEEYKKELIRLFGGK